MKFLHFTSLLLILVACSPRLNQLDGIATGKTCLLSATPEFTSDLYNASIDVSGRHISGLMLFKAMPDSSSRVVFTTETGLTFFDFEWDKKGDFSPKFVIKKLNRKVIVSLLRNDLELILVPSSYSERAVSQKNEIYSVVKGKDSYWFTVTPECKSIQFAEVKHADKLKTKATFFTQTGNVPDSVYIQHYNFNLQIALRRIDRKNAAE